MAEGEFRIATTPVSNHLRNHGFESFGPDTPAGRGRDGAGRPRVPRIRVQKLMVFSPAAIRNLGGTREIEGHK